MTTEATIQNELRRLKDLYPDWDFEATYAGTRPDPTKIIRTLLSELRTTYPTFKFSLACDKYTAFAIINVTTQNKDTDIAYYGGDSVGYVIDNNDYRNLVKAIKNNPDVKSTFRRVSDFIHGRRKGSIEFYC